MADIEFRITDGPYLAEYKLNKADISAADVGALRAQGGPNLDAVLTGKEAFGLEAFAGFVWIVKRRNSSKSIAYRLIAEHINWDVIDTEMGDGSEKSESEEPAEKLLDPSSSDNT